MGRVEAFNYFIARLSHVWELKHEEGTQAAITELGSIMRGMHIGRNSSGNLRISGSLKGDIEDAYLRQK